MRFFLTLTALVCAATFVSASLSISPLSASAQRVATTNNANGPFACPDITGSWIQFPPTVPTTGNTYSNFVSFNGTLLDFVEAVPSLAAFELLPNNGTACAFYGYSYVVARGLGGLGLGFGPVGPQSTTRLPISGQWIGNNVFEIIVAYPSLDFPSRDSLHSWETFPGSSLRP